MRKRHAMAGLPLNAARNALNVKDFYFFTRFGIVLRGSVSMTISLCNPRKCLRARASGRRARHSTPLRRTNALI